MDHWSLPLLLPPNPIRAPTTGEDSQWRVVDHSMRITNCEYSRYEYFEHWIRKDLMMWMPVRRMDIQAHLADYYCY